MKIFIPFLLIAASLFTCTTEEVTTRTYPRVQTESMETITADGVLMKGEITFSSAQILDHGFLWSRESFPEMDKAEKISLGAKDGIGKFEAQVDRNLEEGKTYSTRAYARSGNNLVYGQVQEFISKGCKNKPVISDFTPKQGTSGDVITIQGNYFSSVKANNQIFLADLSAQVIQSTEKEISVLIPSTSVSGPVSVKVVAGGIPVMAKDKFLLGAPKINTISPQTGVIAKTLIEIHGSALGTSALDLKITFGSIECSIVSLANEKIVVKLPPDTPAGNFPIVLEKNGLSYNSPTNFTAISPWTKETEIAGLGDHIGIPIFIIGDNVYFKLLFKQVWRFNFTNKVWQQMADAPFDGGGIPFAINGKCYVVDQPAIQLFI